MKILMTLMLLSIYTASHGQNEKIDTFYFLSSYRNDSANLHLSTLIMQNEFCSFRKYQDSVIYEYNLYGNNVYKKNNKKWLIRCGHVWKVFFDENTFNYKKAVSNTWGFKFLPDNVLYEKGVKVFTFKLFLDGYGTNTIIYFDPEKGIVKVKNGNTIYSRFSISVDPYIECHKLNEDFNGEDRGR